MSKSISKTYKMENIENTKSTFFPATRGTSFTLEEDILLCNCWATVSIDGNRYTDQQASTMWGSIHLLFNKDKSEEEKRIEPSLKKRWCKINKEVSDYIGFYNQILGLKPNEVNEWDIVSIEMIFFDTKNDSLICIFIEKTSYISLLGKFSNQGQALEI